MKDFSCTFIPSVFSCECKLNKDGTIKSFEDIELKEHGCVKVYYKGKKIYSIRFMLSEDEIKRCFKEDITMVSSTKGITHGREIDVCCAMCDYGLYYLEDIITNSINPSRRYDSLESMFLEILFDSLASYGFTNRGLISKKELVMTKVTLDKLILDIVPEFEEYL